MNWSFVLPALCGFLFTFALVKGALRFFPQWGLLDRPHRYGLKRAPIPYYGGVCLYLAFVVCVLLFVDLNWEVVGLLLGGSLIAGVGFLDDRYSLSPLVRLFVQFLAGVILVVCGVGVLSINLPFLGQLDLDYVWNGVMVLSALFTVLWVMAIVNTMNFVDGVTGLSSGVSFIAGVTLFLLSTNEQLHENFASQHEIAIISIILAGCSLAFLLFDFPKAKILIGDTGSTFLGFLLATLAIFSGGKVATAFIVLALPILDMVWVVLRRLREHGKFWKGDRKHLHHRFLSLGMSERQVVGMYLVITAAFGFGSVLLVSSKQKFFMIIATVFLMVLMGLFLVFARKKG